MGGIEAALVSGILNIVRTKLAPLVTKEFSSIAGVTKDLQDLHDLVQEISIWLERVGSRAIGNANSFNWLERLKDTAFDAEDLVNKFHTKYEKHDINVAGDKNVVTKYLWKKPKLIVFECKTAHEIKRIKKRFDEIVKGRSDYSTIANSMPVDHPVQHLKMITGEVPQWTVVDKTLIFGRDQEKDLMTSELIETNNQGKIKIVSVIGLGGSGKTTLAKLVFDDSTIKNHFDYRLWVHVSREFDVEKLTEKLFEAIAAEKPDHLPMQRVSSTISDKLAGKKFLAVLDDVWTEDRIHWEQFMVHLKNGAPGSSILLTTRSRKVAEAVDSTYTFDLPFLSEEDSWKMFQQSFGIAVKDLDPEFLQVGIEIVNKCGGVPLAVKVLAGVLHGMKGIEEWQSIRDSNILDVEDEEHRVFACLWLSYFHLPPHLKPCFIHCSIFPRGYEINRRHLISQWIAHGFVLRNQTRQPEDVGIGYFDTLMKVGFLQDRKQYRYRSGEVTCKMHDLIHDLARQILQDEFVCGIATTDQIKMCRYLSLTSWPGEVDKKLLDKVRALYVSGRSIAFDKTMNKQCCVRTIILKYISVDSLPLFVSKFEHVGYLEICNVNCEALPEAISHCWNLQAIHVIKCTRLANLPESIGKLKKLRTLELNNAGNIRNLPQSICDCGNLQSLYLEWCGIKNMPNSIGKMVNLRVLSIVSCRNLQQLPESFGKLCHLQTITLCYSLRLQHLPQCITSLSRLESVDLRYCWKLVELPEGLGNLINLKVLNLKRCNKLCGLPAGCGKLTRLQQLGLFVIGNSTKHAGISELENLEKLNGELKIKSIKYVKDPGDAERVRLMEKSGIQKLSLDWYAKGALQASDNVEIFSGVRTEEELPLDMEKDVRLLNCLEPPSEIEKLRISGYRGMQLPHWMMKQNGSCDLSDINMLKPKSQFHHLTKLVLKNLPNLEHLRELVDLPGIKVLKLRGMPKLAELLTTTSGLANGEEGVEVQHCFPCLHDLVISDCPKLVLKPYFPPSLQRLTLEGRNEQLLSSGCFFHAQHAAHAPGNEASPSLCIADAKPRHITRLKLGRMMESSSGWEALQHLTGLYDLEIAECQDLKQLPDSMRGFTSLRRLDLERCDNLCMLPEWLGEFRSLQSLSITNLPAMSVLPESLQRLTALRSLIISGCGALHQLPEQFGELCSLANLAIWCLPALTQLPESMRRLTSLQSLNLAYCGALTQLPESLGELSALQELWIQGCSGLTSFPRFIGCLTALEQLMISQCPELVRRCREGVGEDWNLVSHIPDLELWD
jgi:Leucine-rich repeat (LRR) protein